MSMDLRCYSISKVGQQLKITFYFTFFPRHISGGTILMTCYFTFLEAAYLRWEMLMGTGWIGFLQLSRVAVQPTRTGPQGMHPPSLSFIFAEIQFNIMVINANKGSSRAIFKKVSCGRFPHAFVSHFSCGFLHGTTVGRMMSAM